ncbi:hypothetical protein [Nocardia crassostreae]|uniref:hypothetical protein n=1 Tax=Nocardia crassostreae TaxID=53428 RepID=UPI0008376D8C|nr:hypothetical protein [Nocardia crassostreae]
MTIDIGPEAMVSDVSPEYAFRVSGRGETVWRLSWLPEHRLTRDQARAGMELDEILSNPDIVEDTTAHGLAGDRAASLGIAVEQAVLVLARRTVERVHGGLPAAWTAEIDTTEPLLSGWYTPGHVASTSGARSQHLWR